MFWNKYIGLKNSYLEDRVKCLSRGIRGLCKTISWLQILARQVHWQVEGGAKPQKGELMRSQFILIEVNLRSSRHTHKQTRTSSRVEQHYSPSAMFNWQHKMWGSNKIFQGSAMTKNTRSRMGSGPTCGEIGWSAEAGTGAWWRGWLCSLRAVLCFLGKRLRSCRNPEHNIPTAMRQVCNGW